MLYARRININPQPYALDAPKPFGKAVSSCFRSVTVSAPSKSIVENAIAGPVCLVRKLYRALEFWDKSG